MRAATGSILFLPMPIDSTLSHVIEQLPNDSNMEIFVDGTERQRFSKGKLCSVHKVNLDFKKIQFKFRW